MKLYQRRERDRQKAERAARGEVPKPTPELSDTVRVKLVHAIRDASPEDDSWRFCESIQQKLVRDWGRFSLSGRPSNPPEDVFGSIVSGSTPEEVRDIIEATFYALGQYADENRFRGGAEQTAYESADLFRDTVNDVFDDHDIAYQVVGVEVIDRESMALHANVIAPTLSLLHGEPRFVKVEAAFQDALHELKPDGNPADAITDAGTALQEMLGALGCTGNALGPRLDDAKKKGLLGPYDSKLARGVELIGDWLNADRSTRGDAHNADEATREDGWLAVHVAGALIARLACRS